jgi:transcription elongation factor Elf1
MEETFNCTNCGNEVETSYTPAYQEYPGAGVQGGYHYFDCKACGHDDIIKADLSNFNYRENTRGW